ncbi:hypothetical protein GCM10010230_25310 [Streptomyces narbonensis]|nr:hypothetical protein GCM10010230_25310 [Streptomyces narbonensis]
MQLPKPLRIYDPQGGWPPERGPAFRFAELESRPEPAITTRTATTSYGKSTAQSWDRVHPRLTLRTAWLDRVVGADRLFHRTCASPARTGCRPGTRGRTAGVGALLTGRGLCTSGSPEAEESRPPRGPRA